jgi:hypothetical protein
MSTYEMDLSTGRLSPAWKNKNNKGVVAERFDYSTALYIDAAIVILALAVMPFLRNREARQFRPN